MLVIKEMKPGKYVLAVSGGVDSVVLLDLLSKQKDLDLVVAHFDHGIRADSAADRKFVGQLADKHGLPFEYEEGNLGHGASEETARDARYGFLSKVQDEHDANAIVTAHHEDDVIETAIINLIRGTHSRGLSALKSTEKITRPLIDTSRREVERYAEYNDLKWKEDPTNKDTRYLRNYVRLSVIPALNRQDPKWRKRLLNKIKRSGEISLEINTAIDHLADDNLVFEGGQIIIPKNWLIMLPNAIGIEVMKHVIERLEASADINQPKLKSSLMFIKTARPGKKRHISKYLEITVGQREVRVSAL